MAKLNDLRKRLIRSNPVWRDIVERSGPLIDQQLVDGGAAGAIAVSRIKQGDQLVGVIEFAAASNDPTDRTSEFVANTDSGQIIKRDGFIDNTGGTATTSDKLLVTWVSWMKS